MNINTIRIMVKHLPESLGGKNLWEMIDLAKIREAKLPAKLEGRTLRFNWNGKHASLTGNNSTRQYMEVFIGGCYEKLGCKGRTVLDIGAAFGDTALYFNLQGAKRVIAYECDTKHRQDAERNMLENRIGNIEFVWQPATDLAEMIKRHNISRGSVAKLDCEGCEYGLIESANKETLRHFGEFIMEYHGFPDGIENKLRKAGFETSISSHLKSRECGILYAWRQQT